MLFLVPAHRWPHSRRRLQQPGVVAEPGAGHGAEQRRVGGTPQSARGATLSLVLPSRRQGAEPIETFLQERAPHAKKDIFLTSQGGDTTFLCSFLPSYWHGVEPRAAGWESAALTTRPCQIHIPRGWFSKKLISYHMLMT